jgi:Flp pilus assembly protein TadB
LKQADVDISPFTFLISSTFVSLLLGYLSFVVFSEFCAPVFLIIGGSIPWFWLSSRIRNRVAAFSADYPTVLMAAATSIKAGMTPLAALSRAVELLPETSLCKKETAELMRALDSGVERELALQKFGNSIALPELSLFRTAFAMVMTHGGPFVPTLERLAKVSRERVTLIASAGVSTASMRMTGNVLLAVIPIVLVLLSAGNKSYWDLLRHNELANLVGTIGVSLIVVGYLCLRIMSNFKP